MTGPNLRKIFMGLIASIAVLSVVFGIFGNRYLARSPAEEGASATSGALEGLPVPDVDSDVAENIAKPHVSLPAGPATDARLRVFDLEVNGDKFSKDTIIVNQWDIVRINLSSVDKTYDFSLPALGTTQVVKRGETKPIEFQAVREGTFEFYCGRCGGPAKGPVGTLVIVASR